MNLTETSLTPSSLVPKIRRFWARSAECIDALEARLAPEDPTPVFTVGGKYTARGWTEWTQGFRFGSAILQFDATGEEQYLALGRDQTIRSMASHLTHRGVHDHGFNNVSTYGNLWRLLAEGRLPESPFERNFYELALKASGAVQSARWTKTEDGTGFIHSFNGPQSLFIDTLRTLRVLSLAHQFGQRLYEEQDERIQLLTRLVEHGTNTARYNIFYGEGRDAYDVAGRTAHEALFNVKNGTFRCPSTQQGYSPFTTWTRGLAWAMLGFSEQLEWLASRRDKEFDSETEWIPIEKIFLKAARVTCDYYLQETPSDGVPYWDTGAPGLVHLGNWRDRPADPWNEFEPVDSSAAAIAAQGLLRLGHYLVHVRGETAPGVRYVDAGLAIADTLLDEPYLSSRPRNEGLLLHSIYHRPNRWDYIPDGRAVPCGEASMWGDYHLRELALYIERLTDGRPYLAFFGPGVPDRSRLSD